MTKSSTQLLEEHDRKTRSVIDLRSDTVTRPTAAMRKAMAEAEVGDDVYGEDPTVNRLEADAARIFQREAALFVPTGTMGNQIAIKVHTRPGQEIICEERAHILDWEMGMPALFSGCVLRTLRGDDGVLTWAEIKKKIPAYSYARAQTGLIVAGHIAAVVIAHLRLSQLGLSRRRSLAAEAPLNLLMVGYTVFGLWLMSTPVIA